MCNLVFHGGSMNIVEIADHVKVDPEVLEMEWLEHERDLAFKRMKSANNPFELEKANSLMKYIIWRIESISYADDY